VLDYRFHSTDARLLIELEESSGKRRTVKVKKQEYEDIGLDFETYLMDKAHSCANKCIFCFVDQLPKGLRETLYFKDDDARLSFLMGNYITLTNLSEREALRICQQRISPINISVHTTDPELRCYMLGNKRAGKGLETMRRFAEAGIEMNCQIVCCPGVNDGEALEKTMSDLSEMYPAVSSVSIVPVGLTKHREGLEKLRPVDKTAACGIIDSVEKHAGTYLREKGSRIFFCSDELYIRAERPLPAEEEYEGYPQLENGVGLIRSLTEEFDIAMLDAMANDGKKRAVATGVSAAPYIRELAEKSGADCAVYAVKNEFFGESVDVAGLVTGGDLINQLMGKPLGSELLIPACMLRHGGDMFLDNVKIEEVSEKLGVPVRLVAQDGADLLRALYGIV